MATKTEVQQAATLDWNVVPSPITPAEVFGTAPTVVAAQEAADLAEEKVAALEGEQRDIANAQIDARSMAKDMSKFWDLQRRWGELDAEVYIAKANSIEAQAALLETKLTALQIDVPEMKKYIDATQVQIAELQARIAPLGACVETRKQMVDNLRSYRVNYDNKMAALENEWAGKLRGKLPVHLRDSVKR